MSESQNGSTTWRGRALVLAVVAAVALAGAGAFVVGGSPTAQAGGAADWSPHPGKEVSCPPANETTPDNDTTPANETGNASDDSGYQLVINYTGAWQGTIVTNDTNIPIEGTGDETIDIEADEDERIAATVSKANVTEEVMGVTLLLNGIVIDEQKPVEPTVDNFDDTDDGASADDTSTDSTSSSTDPAFASTSDTDSLNETGTGDGWTTFGEENEASAFEDDTVVAEDDDPFNDSETANANDDSLDSSDTDTSDTDDTDEANSPNDANETDDAAEECVQTENTTTQTANNTTTEDASIAVETDEEAQVVFADQTHTEDSNSLVVESATVPDSGFVVIHNMSLMQDGDVEDSVIGVSEKLDAQRSEDIEVTLADEITESQTLIAVVYRDTDGDGSFEFADTGDMVDEPYRDDNGSAVADDAYVTMPGADEADASAFDDEDTTTTASAQDASVFTDTVTPTATATATATDTPPETESPNEAVSGNAAEQSTETNAPGFGIGVAVVAMLGAALVATRRN